MVYVLATLFPLGNPESGEVDDLAVFVGDKVTIFIAARAVGEVHVLLIHDNVERAFLVIGLAALLAELDAYSVLGAVLARERSGVKCVLGAVSFLALCEDCEFHCDVPFSSVNADAV